MKKMKVISLILILGLVASIFANGPRKAGPDGARWAKLSEQAQIELLINRFRQANLQSVPGKMLTSRLAENVTLKTSLDRNAPDIFVDGTDAVAEFADGSRLTLKKENNSWKIISGNLPVVSRDVQTVGNRANLLAKSSSGLSAGETFIPVPLSDEHDVQQLSKSVTQSALDRTLFGAPGKTAAYYTAKYSDTVPFISSTYIQFVTDPSWNRVLYGSLNRWIKVYEDVKGPSAIAVDADGRVFLSEQGRQRVSVLQISPDDENTELTFRFAIPNITDPVDIAHNDNGTPLNISDDYLYVIDGAENKLLKFSLSENSAALVAEFEGFQFPSAIEVSRWNGVNTNFLYVIDKVGKRIRLYDENDGMLTELASLRGGYDQYFSEMKTDHFGNIYVVDNVHSQLYKYAPDFTFLDTDGLENDFDGLSGVAVPFGKVELAGEGTFWAGYNQLFSLERWSENSGVQRRQLGLRIKNAAFHADTDISIIHNDFMLTDVSDVSARVYNEENELIREIPAGWLASGSNGLSWDRRNAAGEFVPAGNYYYELAATSSYDDKPVEIGVSFYLPLYYWQNGGSDAPADNSFLVQGEARRWGDAPSQSVAEHAEAVIYRFRGLNPESDYEINLEAVANDGIVRQQTILVNNQETLSHQTVANEPVQTGYLTLGKSAYQNGEVEIRIVNNSRATALVSQVWLKETGKGFTVQPALTNGEIPTRISLEQNYPNPFNPSTQIRFQLPEDAKISLAVFNILGQQVRELAAGNYAAGIHTLSWDGRSEIGAKVASGIYIYRLTAGELVQSRRMLLLK